MDLYAHTAEAGKRVRCWAGTLNNWTQHEYDKLLNIDCKYMCIGKEVGEMGTPHLQMCFFFDN
jgi:hypothetical protein